MNANQLKVLWISASIVVAMAIYPPWQYESPTSVEERGYSLLFVAPAAHSPEVHRANRVDMRRLFVGIFIVSVIGLVLICSLKKSKCKAVDEHMCPACSMPYELGAKFCHSCGEQLL